MLKIFTGREKTIFYLTAGLIVFALTFNFLLVPLFARISRLNKEIALTRMKLVKYSWLLSQKDFLMAKYAAGGSSGNTSDQDDPLLSGLSAIELLAQQSNIRIIDIRPDPQVKSSGQHKEALIELRAEGEVKGFFAFIYKLENSLTLLKIKKFQLSLRPGNQALEGRFTIVVLFVSETDKGAGR